MKASSACALPSALAPYINRPHAIDYISQPLPLAAWKDDTFLADGKLHYEESYAQQYKWHYTHLAPFTAHEQPNRIGHHPLLSSR